MKLIWYVALGGAAGSALRFVVSGAIQRATVTGFPSGTLVVNITGSLLLGLLMSYALSGGTLPPATRALLTTGFCGGYTTFSTFSYETVALLQEGDWRRAGLSAALSLVVSFLAVWIGLGAGAWLAELRRA